MQDREHWEKVYRSRPSNQVSWYQLEPRLSLELIARVSNPRTSAVIDVGAGASTLVDGLLDRGYSRPTILDISPSSLEAAKTRLGSAAGRVNWIVADVLSYPLPGAAFDVWHDRAVFHFLTRAEDRNAYVEQVRRAVRAGGHVIVAAFAADGPTRCSGLEVRRYAPEELHGQFGPSFQLLDHRREEHHTPAGIIQPFEYCLCLYRASG